MNFGSSFGISASALTAQRLRMDVISSNVANAETTRASVVDGKAVPYRRKLVVMEATESNKFSNILNSKLNGSSNEGVKVQSIIEDTSPLKPVYNPSHPDADAEGYVYMPNVDITKEMVDMLSASRSYEANVTMLNASKAMVSKALEIGR
ncbi:flagellar basal body rod protein FlgC [Paenibacillus sp. VTT E-133280]|jgi:flagellar basal-body rod protein FlgC|uniref:flagellar basal body rod protein FlgC n=1 Tax=Paenibacillus TaxID=44249 RepID=UPI000BA06612|nr:MULTISPECIES: flagellar basal body rod protein FlgC [unclassified Paenibacillus]MBY3618642.1 flagellar basal body rod protein FlgC [Acinetobacter sp. CUI P1]KAA1185168.1 flagellar basal body rod protein FlgC [Paenibacillus sp. B2(2019)]MDH6369179.1 flagellar basal-body rod protein FlgC [Paenibacillus sp. PastF-3]OZQ68083.1 flagellar basal body rod protein FlgC [Paenibacillus sp. VTT E-133280]OZQ97238.1 flagellar basal body rod protein FlgC [Paenibacillus sp. VTT E-133291]